MSPSAPDADLAFPHVHHDFGRRGTILSRSGEFDENAPWYLTRFTRGAGIRRARRRRDDQRGLRAASRRAEQGGDRGEE